MTRCALGSSLLVCLGVMMTGCGDDGGSANGCDSGQVECDDVCIPEIQPMLAGANGIQASVFQTSCTASACHDASSPQEQLELTSAAVSEANLVDVDSNQVDKLRVAPGDPDASYLMDKLRGENLAPATAQMPNVGIPLCDAKIQAVEDWIAAGAN